MADKRFLELVEEMKRIHIAKNAGYAGMDNPDSWANFRMAESFGVSAFKGCLIRMSDKYIRISNLVKNPANDKVGESIKDTLIDLANYSLIAICLLEEMERKDCTQYGTTVAEFEETIKHVSEEMNKKNDKRRNL